MAQPRIIMKALRIKRILGQLARAKENRIREMVGLPPIMSWHQQLCMACSSSVREVVCRSCCPCCVRPPSFRELCCPKFSFGYRLCTDGEYPNELIKTFCGFLSGLVLTIGIFFFICLQLEANLQFAFTICLILAPVLSLGLAFSGAVRCLVLLALPNFCSSKGRSFLILYAMVLIVNHPVQNFFKNLTVLSDAATCGQSMALNETKKLVETAAAPLMTVIGGIKKMFAAIRGFADELRNAFKALMRAVKEIVSVIAKVFKWLGNIVNVCNHNMGEPYRKCKKVFEDGYNKCADALGPFKFLCEVVSLVGKVCHIARIGELLCIIAAAVKDLVMEQVGPPIMRKIGDVKQMFYFNVSITYHFHYNMNQSRPYSEIKAAIMKEIKAKLSIFDIFQGIFDNVMPLTILLVVMKALMYRRAYLNKDGYDNVYITRLLYEIDHKRIEMNKENIFPLRFRESFKYIKTFSYKMTKNEIKKMVRGFLFWCFATFHATYYMVCDYGLYWILNLVRKHMDVKTKSAIPPFLKLHVQGQGPMSDMYKAMVGVIEPVSDAGIDIDTTACLPNPFEPNWAVNKTVIVILVICFNLVTFEAYGLRLRHVVASCYYPYRERQRAVWLYNHILTMRGSFLQFTRRQLHIRKENATEVQKISFLSRLSSQFPLLRKLFAALGFKRIHCLSCGEEGKPSDTHKFVFCDNCKSPYCNECFIDLGNVCTACMHPVDYGGSDISVETDSSEEEEDKRIRVANLKERKQEVIKRQAERRPSQVMQAFRTKFGLPENPSDLARMQRASSQSTKSTERSLGSSTLEEQETDIDDYNDDELDETTASESSSEYDTDYQYGKNTSFNKPVEYKKRSKSKSMKRKVELVTIDIFNSEDKL